MTRKKGERMRNGTGQPTEEWRGGEEEDYLRAQEEAGERIAMANPNAKVYRRVEGVVREPWKTDRLMDVFDAIVSQTLKKEDDEPVFNFRKRLLRENMNGDVLPFQQDHPKLYFMLTDKKTMSQAKYRDALKGMVLVQREVERGNVAKGKEADSMAGTAVLRAIHSHACSSSSVSRC